MADRKVERVDGAPGRLTFRVTTGAKEDLAHLIKSAVRDAAPRVVRERKKDLDDQIRRREGQTTDSNNKY
jgi:hypothetical protein